MKHSRPDGFFRLASEALLDFINIDAPQKSGISAMAHFQEIDDAGGKKRERKAPKVTSKIRTDLASARRLASGTLGNTANYGG
jgi:hypothetical protein